MSLATRFLFKFEYRAQFHPHGAENELCWVFAGRSSDQPKVNGHEVAAWRYVSARDLTAEIGRAPDTFTPWFKIAWRRITATGCAP